MAENGGIPTSPARFLAWADKDCTDWPADLSIKASRALQNWEARDGSFEAFVDAYGLFRRG